MSLSITWLGHSTFLLELPSGRRVVIDPWLSESQLPAGLREAGVAGPVDLDPGVARP